MDPFTTHRLAVATQSERWQDAENAPRTIAAERPWSRQLAWLAYTLRTLADTLDGQVTRTAEPVHTKT